MSYLAKLKAFIHEKVHTQPTAKGDKSPSVGFDSAQGRHISDPGRPIESEAVGEIRRLIEAIARVQPYWSAADVEEALQIAQGDVDNAQITYRALAEQYGVPLH